MSEERLAHIGERDVPYVLKRSVERRRMVLSVDEAGLTVSVPWRTSERAIDDLLAQSAAWILRKLEQYSARRPRPRIWQTGESVDFLGRALRLRLREHGGRASVQVRDADELELAFPAPHEPERVHALVVAWYRRQAAPHFHARVQHFASHIDMPVPKVILSSAKGRWGSCNARGEVRLSWRLMQARPDLIDYVVVHEVAHLRMMNHSPRFWKLVERVYPEYQAARAELDNLGQHYMAL